MRLASLEVLGCPVCHGPLIPSEPRGSGFEEGSLRCAAEGISYPVADGIPRLVTAEGQARLRELTDEYSAVWRKDGWGGSTPEYLLALPYRDVTGREPSKWKVKARSLDALLALVAGLAAHRAADLGAGTGWLSYRLAQAGLDVYAVDMVLDEVLGLGAAGTYLRHGVSFERAQGDLSQPPFRAGSLDLVICNASLHYAPSVSETLAQVARILRPGGSFVVMNSPVHVDPRSRRKAEGDFRAHLVRQGASERLAASYHHFVRSELVASLEEAIGPVEEVRYDPGAWFRWTRRLKGMALRMELARFPILRARCESVRGPGSP